MTNATLHKPSKQQMVEAEILSRLASTPQAMSARDLYPLCDSADSQAQVYSAIGSLARDGHLVCVGTREIKGAKAARLYRPAQEADAIAAASADKSTAAPLVLDDDESTSIDWPDAIDGSEPRGSRYIDADPPPSQPTAIPFDCDALLTLEPGLVPSGIRWCRFAPSGERQNDELVLNVEDDGAGPYLVLSFDRGDEFIFETPGGLQALADIGRELLAVHERG